MLALTAIIIIFELASSMQLDNIGKSNKCLENIIKNAFGEEKYIEIVAKNFDEAYIPTIPIILTKTTLIKNFDKGILYLEDVKDLSKLNPKGKYVIVTKNASVITDLLKVVQKQGLYKFLLLEGEHIYYVGNFQLVKTKGCKYPPRIFSIRKKFNNRRLKIGYITTPPFVINTEGLQNPGIMVSMINLLGEVMGMGVDYQNSTHFNAELISNGSVHQIGRALETRLIDIAIGRLMMNDTKTTPFDFGPVLYRDAMKFSTPKPKKLKSYRKLFIVFNIEIWVRIFAGIFIMIFIFYIFGLFENFQEANIFSAMMDVVQVSLGSGVSKLPKWVSFRILLVLFSLCSLSIDSVYLGNLSQIFAFTSYDVNIDNLDMVHAVRMKFEITWRVERLVILKYVLRGNPRADDQLFIRNFTQSYLLNNTALAKQNGTILFESLLSAHPSEFSLLDIFSVITDYLTLFVTYYFNKDTFFNEALAFWGREIVEKGFPIKWFDDIKTSNVRVSILPEEEKKMVVLKLAHFEESFRVLLGGYALAVIALPLEFLYLKLEKTGLVKRAKDSVVFLVMLLKPPKLQKKNRWID